VSPNLSELGTRSHHLTLSAAAIGANLGHLLGGSTCGYRSRVLKPPVQSGVPLKPQLAHHVERPMTRAVALLLVASILLLPFGCVRKDTYQPTYYPNRNDLTDYTRGPVFDSLDDARTWAYEENERRGDRNWDYEIGKNCKRSDFGDVQVCEETLK